MEEKLHENTLNRTRNYTKPSCLFVFLCVFLFVWFSVSVAEAAVLSISPTAGTFSTDSTFNISIFLDTQGQSINAIEASLKFQPDKLQLVSPNIGQSIISIWTSQPKFDNQNGTVTLQGIIPGGINVSNGLVATLSFRAKSTGQAILKFLDNTKVLLNDGLGTDVLKQTQSGIYQLILPPPAGPIIVSETHPEQSKWYLVPNVIFRWSYEPDVDGYSYVLNDNPVDIPDDISEGTKNSVAYKNISSGVHYFHLKALRDNAWGGTSHFAVHIDTVPPAEFPIEISPSKRTAQKQPVINFATTDEHAGLDHYELKIITLKPQSPSQPQSSTLFIEAVSPYVPNLDIGEYDVIVRAFDRAGNYREEIARLKIVNLLFEFVTGEGLRIRSYFTIAWIWLWVITGLLVIGLGYLGWRIRRWHREIDTRRAGGELPDQIKKHLRELDKYREKYGKLTATIILIFALSLIFYPVFAQTEGLEPPLISTISRDISNEEIFYVGGKTEAPMSQVIIYLQNLRTGETISEIATSDKRGDWFYSHNAFLSSGDYRLWVQSKIGDELSPPSPEVKMTVRQTAIQFGASRISYEIIYLIVIIILLFLIAGLAGYIVFHSYHGRQKHKRFMKEISEAEEAVRRGFEVLRHDIEIELAVIKKAKLTKDLSGEEKIKEEQLLKDLKEIERHISKEVFDIERTEYAQ